MHALANHATNNCWYELCGARCGSCVRRNSRMRSQCVATDESLCGEIWQIANSMTFFFCFKWNNFSLFEVDLIALFIALILFLTVCFITIKHIIFNREFLKNYVRTNPYETMSGIFLQEALFSNKSMFKLYPVCMQVHVVWFMSTSFKYLCDIIVLLCAFTALCSVGWKS